MKKIISTFHSVLSLPVAFFTWFHATTIAPENDGKPVPPIRSGGDPTDIYLA